MKTELDNRLMEFESKIGFELFPGEKQTFKELLAGYALFALMDSSIAREAEEVVNNINDSGVKKDNESH